MYDQMSLLDSPSATSSPALESGASPCAPAASRIANLSGPDPALASLSARQAKEMGLLTSGTFGHTSTTSSASAALQRSLESRLRARTQCLGSTLYTLTWKPWVTPSGRSRSRLRASVGRTSATASTGVVSLPVSPWVTPAARDYKDSEGMATTGVNPDGSVRSRLDQLPRQANLAGWPTCREADGEKNVRTLDGALSEMERKGSPQDLCMGAVLTGWPTCTATDAIKLGSISPRPGAMGLSETVPLAGWGTPTASEPGGTGEQYLARSQGKTGNTFPSMLTHQVAMAGWPTTSCNNDRTGNPNSALLMQRPDGSKVQQRLQDFAAICGPARLTASGDLLIGSTAAMASGGQLSPEHSRWLQGCPEAWATCHPNYSDWRQWQDFLRLHSSAQKPTESVDCVPTETPSTP